jgi:hypothetical protein
VLDGCENFNLFPAAFQQSDSKPVKIGRVPFSVIFFLVSVYFLGIPAYRLCFNKCTIDLPVAQERN